MQITLESNTFSYRIHAYDDGSITVAIPKQREPAPEEHPDAGGKLALWRDTLEHSLVISPEHLLRNWGSDQFEQLQAGHFSQLLQFQPEIVLFGSGRTLRRPAASLLAPLIDAGIGVEIMDTGAACRTYNILMNDDRRVCAALLLI